MKKIVTICGPTGIGKTGFAIKLAKRFDGQIIGADSMQIYKYMDIGTAKPDAREIRQVPHHMIDFLEPDDEYDAGQYARQASAVIDALDEKGTLAVVAGGTGLYIRALIFGLFRSAPVCGQTLSRLADQAQEKGGQSLHDRLRECDPKAAKRIHPNDIFRLIRALEVFESTGRAISTEQETHGFSNPKYDSLTLGLTMDREVLYDRINQRVDIMMNQGLLKEVAGLVEKGYSLGLKSMQSIGYRHMGMFLNQTVDLDEAVRLLKRDTRRYAKRQFTWFRKEPGIIWLNPSEVQRAEALVKQFLDGRH